ncbi:hypothetical protein DS837_13375 [Azospirillum brasilense]|uniref:Uncharacterized protein n=2 Tax=Azospirillum brasilense TaxID=192 RepID=A0A6L3B058_AZOBR|nr:hypothetical protein DS837_13375 [Azospirillum brasilense]
MNPIAAIIGKIAQSIVAVLLLALTACEDGGGARWARYGVGYGGSGPVYTLGLGLPAYRLEPRSYWNYPDYRGLGPVIELASRPGS